MKYAKRDELPELAVTFHNGAPVLLVNGRARADVPAENCTLTSGVGGQLVEVSFKLFLGMVPVVGFETLEEISALESGENP